ncbi:hypothetical protein PIB30_098800 [Stylosanthes scabra]|uniref:RNA polymerase sigma-70 region 2 domain-containing protein n=1 Tax=Stylosanthes scabra TaxID=79078 RepID=A0ABU6RX49_9FABA|nr:hypothetical protein [Stylosanthes scabra]
MSKAVKVLAELEITRKAIEKNTSQVTSLRSWAEASGVDEKVLLQQLHYGRYCQDELIEAGYEGVLQGAERFDSARSYRFSTYAQYWIKKSMSRMVARYARGIIILRSLNKALN